MGFFSRRSPKADAVAGTVDTAEHARPLCRGSDRVPGGGPVRYLVREGGGGAGPERFPFGAQLEIGRDEEGRSPTPGHLLVNDPSISFRHCLLTVNHDGTCCVRDVSRNGTRLNGRRLIPNVESEFLPGQVLDLGPGLQFILEADPAVPATSPAPSRRGRTEVAPKLTLATVLVGDIHDYTVMVRRAPAMLLQQSVSRVFETLSMSVLDAGGTVKEFPGDALLAFWEGDLHGGMALSACRAAMALDREVRRIAADPAIWGLPDFPLRMDWAMATGQVSIDSFGGASPVGLSMIGEPVVLACRIEKFATDATGPILACPNTRTMVLRALRGRPAEPGEPELDFSDLGEMQAKGFDRPDHVFALRLPNG